MEPRPCVWCTVGKIHTRLCLSQNRTRFLGSLWDLPGMCCSRAPGAAKSPRASELRPCPGRARAVTRRPCSRLLSGLQWAGPLAEQSGGAAGRRAHAGSAFLVNSGDSIPECQGAVAFPSCSLPGSLGGRHGP